MSQMKIHVAAVVKRLMTALGHNYVTQKAVKNALISETSGGNISGISQANPGVVTSASHGLTVGSEYRVLIASVSGMTDVNGVSYTITAINANTFGLGVNSSGYEAYTSGGTWKLMNKTSSISAIAEHSIEGVVYPDFTVTGHQFFSRDTVYLHDIKVGGVAETRLPNGWYTVTRHGVNSFTVVPLSGVTYTTYLTSDTITGWVSLYGDDTDMRDMEHFKTKFKAAVKAAHSDALLKIGFDQNGTPYGLRRR